MEQQHSKQTMMIMNNNNSDGGVKFLSVVNNDVGAEGVSHLLQYVYSEKIPTLEEGRAIFALFQETTTTSKLWEKKKEMVTGVNGLYSRAIFRIIPFLEEEEKEMICYVSGDKMTVLQTFVTTTTTTKDATVVDPTAGVTFLARVNNSTDNNTIEERTEAVTKLLSYSGKAVLTLEQAQELFSIFQKVDDWNEKKDWLLSSGVNSLFPAKPVFYLLPDPSNQSEMVCYWSDNDDTITILQTEVVEAKDDDDPKKVFDFTGVNLLDATTSGALTIDVDTSTTGTSTNAGTTEGEEEEEDVLTVTSKATTTSKKKRRKKILPKNRKSLTGGGARSTSSGRLPLNYD